MNLKKTTKTLSLSLLTSSILMACGGGGNTANIAETDHPDFSRKSVEKDNIKYKPSGDITSKTPVFLWHATKGATDYRLGHEDTATEETWSEYTVTDQEAGCVTNYGCSYKPTDEIKVGDERVWWVRAKVNGKWRDWSDAHTFTVVDDTTPATETWNNNNVQTQSGVVTANFTATPAANNIDSVIGFSKGDAGAYSDLGMIVRFAETGMIDARNGGSYKAVTSVPYKAGTKYTFRLDIDFTKHNYSIYVKPSGEREVLLGTDFSFRTEQKNMNSIDTVVEYTVGGQVVVSHPTFSKSEAPHHVDMIHQDDFEGHSLNSEIWGTTWYTNRMIEGGIKPEIVTNIHRSGKSSLKIRAEKGANGIANYTRTEITARRSDKEWGRFTKFFDHGKDYWIGFSVYLPTNWVNDYKSNDVIFQLHGNNGGGGKHEIPLLALVVSGDQWRWNVAWEKGSNFGEKVYGNAPLEKGKWVDFVIHEKFSDSNDGLLEIWKDGEKYITREGANSYEKNDGYVRGPQTGIYKWDWTSGRATDATKRVMYLDSVKVAEDASYDDVTPK